MFGFAYGNVHGIMYWNIQSTFCFFCPLAVVIQDRYRKDCFTRENRKNEWNNLYVLLRIRRAEKKTYIFIFLYCILIQHQS